jgi:hypothetical protein
MSATNWITVGGIVMAAIITLIVADQNRKQMRQLEAHRLDPSIGLIPPPHPVFLFLRKYLATLCVGGYGLYLLISEFLVNNQFISRSSVFNIVIGVCLVVFACMLFLIEGILEQVKGIISAERRDKNES